MNPTLRNILAVIAGALLGSIVNSLVLMVGPSIIPNPEGFDNTSMEKMLETFNLLESKHMIVPFLAHALHSLVGAFIAAKLGASRYMLLGMIVGGLAFLGGAYMCWILPAPLWFEITDLVLAYIPMAWLGVRLSGKA